MLSLGAYGAGTDFFALKGVVEQTLCALNVKNVRFAARSDIPAFHPGRCAEISKNGRSIALIGEAHPAVCANYEMGTRAYLGRIDLAALFELADVSDRVYHPLPRFPASTRDLALLCDDSLPMLTIEKAVSKAIGKILESISLFDCYKG